MVYYYYYYYWTVPAGMLALSITIVLRGRVKHVHRAHFVDQGAHFFDYIFQKCAHRCTRNKHRKGRRSLAERRFIHALIHEADIVPRYTNSRE
jgi:hypothetical protein